MNRPTPIFSSVGERLEAKKPNRTAARTAGIIIAAVLFVVFILVRMVLILGAVPALIWGIVDLSVSHQPTGWNITAIVLGALVILVMLRKVSK